MRDGHCSESGRHRSSACASRAAPTVDARAALECAGVVARVGIAETDNAELVDSCIREVGCYALEIKQSLILDEIDAPSINKFGSLNADTSFIS